MFVQKLANPGMVSWKVPEWTSIAAVAVDVLLLDMSSTLKALGRVMTRYWKALFVPLQTSESLLHRTAGLGDKEGEGESEGESEEESEGEGESEGQNEGEGESEGETDGEETAAERLILAKSEKER